MSKEAKIINEVSEILKNLKFGSLLITVNDGEVTQLDITEKKRFPNIKKQQSTIK